MKDRDRILTPRLDEAQTDVIARLIQARGGMRFSGICSGRQVTFMSPEGARMNQGRTCNCLTRGRMEIPYADGSGEKYTACASCDAVNLQPVHLEGEPA